jgi:ferredoxin
MSKKFLVRYDWKNCIGAQKCMGIHPQLWGKDAEGKAVLNGGEKSPYEEGVYTLYINENQLEGYKESALICPAYVIEIFDAETTKSVLNIKPTKEKDKENVPVIRAHYESRKEWKMDPKGFFTIKPYPEEGMIRVRYYGEDHALKFVIEGTHAEEIYNTIVRENLVSTFQHAAYIGTELMKAEIAMKKNLAYVQDDPLP